MNKRIKLKKGILHKKCDMKCPMHQFIVKRKAITCNGCVGCKFRDDVAEKMCKENEKFYCEESY